MQKLRIENLRREAKRPGNLYPSTMCEILNECLDEIERLQHAEEKPDRSAEEIAIANEILIERGYKK